MSQPIPVTPMFSYYRHLQFKGAGREGKSTYRLRLDEAERLLGDPAALVGMFRESLAQTEEYFCRNDFGARDIYPKQREFKKPPGIKSTDALGHWLHCRRETPWRVLGDDSLSFYYLDRELVATRAPGRRMEDGRSTTTGPRLDLLLANAKTGHTIIGEVKLTSNGSPDKDSFFALIQALTAATYLLPKGQMSRLRRNAHDPEKRIDPDSEGALDIYLLTGDAPAHSPIWFELRDHAERLAPVLADQLGDRIHTIAGLDLEWFGDRSSPTRLRITKRFKAGVEA